jgi:hypothetical protein
MHELMLDRRQAHRPIAEAGGPGSVDHVGGRHKGRELLLVQVDLGQGSRPRKLVLRHLDPGVANLPERSEGVRHPVGRDQEVEVPQRAPAVIRVEIVDQPDCAFEQHGLDARAIQSPDRPHHPFPLERELQPPCSSDARP